MWCVIWRSADRYNPAVGTLRVWLFAIARNVVIDEVRRKATRPVAPVPTDSLLRLAPMVDGQDGHRRDRVAGRGDADAQNAGEFVGTGAATMRCNLNSSVLRDDAVGFRVVDEYGREVLTSSLI
jgi:hypothetical protein